MKRAEIVIEGEKIARPIKQSSGWSMETATESGILFVFDCHETAAGGVFVREETLRLLLEELDEKKREAAEKAEEVGDNVEP